MKLICIRAYSDKQPGDEVDLDVEAPARDKDGGYQVPPPWSDLYLAEPDSPAAVRAVADRKTADAGAAGESPAPDADAAAAQAAVAAAKAAAAGDTKEGA